MIGLKKLFMYVPNYPMVFLGHQAVHIIGLEEYFYVRTKNTQWYFYVENIIRVMVIVRIYILSYGGLYGTKYVLWTDVNIWPYSPSRVLVEYS